MNKIIIALAIVLAILVGLLAFFMIRENKASKESTELSTVQTEQPTEATEPTERTEAPTQTDEKQTEATEATELTEPTQAPTEPTEATEEATETAAPIDGEKTNSGQFTSSTGTGLELIVDWTTYASSDGTKMVRFDVSISSFSINVGSRMDGVHITMDGVTKSFDSADVTWSGGKTTHLLASCTMEMSGDSANVDVAWDFRGTYSDTPLEQVTASGTVTR